MRAFLRISALALLAGGFSACGDDVISVNTVSPTATVGGAILNAADGLPISGVTVTLVSGGVALAPATTDATGAYSFEDVAPGGYTINVTAPTGFWGATYAGSFSPGVGDYVLANQSITAPTIGLVPVGMARSLRILAHDGRPVSGYEITGYVPFLFYTMDNGARNPSGRSMFTATTDADGIATFNNLPDFLAMPFAGNYIQVRLPPYDIDSDGITEFSGSDYYVDFGSPDPTHDIILEPGMESNLYVVASTLNGIEGSGAAYPIPTVVGPTDPIYVKFNLPIDSTPVVIVTDENGAPIAQTVSVDVLGDLLTITFSAPLGLGFEYNIRIHAIAHNGDRVLEADLTSSFFTISASPVTATISAHPTNPSAYLRVTFSEPVGNNVGGSYTLRFYNCVAWFNTNLNPTTSTTTGDFFAEYGYDAGCYGSDGTTAADFGLMPAEPDPWGVNTTSGFTKYWDLMRPSTVGSGVGIQLRFSRVTDTNYILERANGELVPDLLTGLFVP